MLNLFKTNKISAKYKYSTIKNPDTLITAIKSLNSVIKHSVNKKIITIVPLKQIYLGSLPREKYNGVQIQYDNGDISDIKCSNISIGVIMWYYDIDNPKFTSYIDYNTKYYIIKSLRE